MNHPTTAHLLCLKTQLPLWLILTTISEALTAIPTAVLTGATEIPTAATAVTATGAVMEAMGAMGAMGA
jgi:hypothetical protein